MPTTLTIKLGTWLLHCHIAFHIGEGLGMQFVENPSQVVLPDTGSYNDVCNSWRSYEQSMPYAKEDSGL